MIKIFYQAAAIITLSLIIGLIFNFVNPKGIPLVGVYSREDRLKVLENKKKDLLLASKESNLKKDFKPSKEERELKSDISLNEAYEIFNNGDVIFIDARKKEDFEKGHILGAINVYAEKLDEYQALLVDIPKDMKIITYCEGTDCDLSIELGNYFVEQGYFDVSIFFGGWDDWQKAGYPTEGVEHK